ncbi:hypothetical protein Pmani_001096 [Petrolisthes manimaculis]|uniref:Uncharacterized protein n=1 Tax=Petrolisthes manimaculis TaxID=1843537 RepID=A0AAE1QNS2_9EUCA|nr:hypothetical protein Pmani_001096 [Petrolisthes manimaculis]
MSTRSRYNIWIKTVQDIDREGEKEEKEAIGGEKGSREEGREERGAIGGEKWSREEGREEKSGQGRGRGRKG